MPEIITPNETEKPKSVTLELLEQMSKLMTSGFGLVAALAWNEAIQDLFRTFFPQQPKGKIFASFLYAVFITAIVVIFTVRLSNLIEKAKKRIER